MYTIKTTTQIAAELMAELYDGHTLDETTERVYKTTDNFSQARNKRKGKRSFAPCSAISCMPVAGTYRAYISTDIGALARDTAAAAAELPAHLKRAVMDDASAETTGHLYSLWASVILQMLTDIHTDEEDMAWFGTRHSREVCELADIPHSLVLTCAGKYKHGAPEERHRILTELKTKFSQYYTKGGGSSLHDISNSITEYAYA